MKKILLFFGAVAMAATASFAQVVNPILPTSATFNPGSVDPEDVYLMDSVNQSITVTFDVQPNVPVAVMYVTGNGFGLGMNYEYLTAVDRQITIDMNREKWGIPYQQTYFLHLAVTFAYDVVNEEGETVPEYYLDADGEPVIFERIYMTPDDGEARLETWFPNNTMFNEDYTFADAYDAGAMYVYFSKPVVAPEDVATVTYYSSNGGFIDSFEVPVLEQEWSDMDGLYQVLFSFASPDFTADKIGKIEIQLNPVKWLNPATTEYENITSPVIVLSNSGVKPQAVPRKVKKGVANGLAVGTESVSVYNLQGILVVKNASTEDLKNLAPGMYIINGQKFVVK